MRFWLSVRSRALDLPKLIALPPPDCSCRMKKKKIAIKSSIGSHDSSSCGHTEPSSGFSIL